MFSHQAIVRLSLSSSLGLALLLLLSFIYSSPIQTQPLRLVIHRQLESIPDGYVQAGKANSSQMITLTVGLQSPNMTGLKARLYEVSMPNSTHYGDHLSKAEVEDHVRPTAGATNALKQWLAMNNLVPKTSSPTGNHIKLELTIGQAGDLLNTSFHIYDHISSNQSIIRTDRYSVPESMNDTIEFIHPTIHFPLNPSGLKTSRSPRLISAVPSNTTLDINRRGVCNFQEVSMECKPVVLPLNVPTVMTLYGVPPDIGVPPTNAHGAIMELGGVSFQATDLAEFLSQWRTDVRLADVQVDILSVNLGDNIQSSTADSNEPNLDVQMLLGLMPSAEVTVIAANQANPEPGSDLLDTLNQLLGQESIPNVLSMSFGSSEANFPLEMAHAICGAIVQYTSRGGSFISSTGDGGVAGDTQPPSTCTTFQPTFPASCPYTLAVGGTDFSSGTEVAWSGSSGGFSNYFPQEKYQADAIDGYFNQIGGINKGLYNTTGRGFPDIALIGVNVIKQDKGQLMIEGGTSASAPLAAAMIVGLNQIRASKGKPPLGFVNPALYSASSGAFSDITQGSNPGCNTNGFPATPGWDAVTGLGSPVFQQLVSIL